MLVKIELLIARLAEHLANDILINGTFVSAKILVSTKVFLCLLVKRGDEQACVVVVNLVIIYFNRDLSIFLLSSSIL